MVFPRRPGPEAMQELFDLLVKQLGITEQQARGGTGVLLRAARDKLGTRHFDELLGGVSGLDQLLGRAAQAGGLGGLLGGITTAVGGNRAALLAQIVSGFTRLDMSPEQAKAFVPVILGFLCAKIGPQAGEELERTLRAGL